MKGYFRVVAQVEYIAPTPDVMVRFVAKGPRGGKVRGRFEPNPVPLVDGTASTVFTSRHSGPFNVSMEAVMPDGAWKGPADDLSTGPAQGLAATAESSP